MATVASAGRDWLDTMMLVMLATERSAGTARPDEGIGANRTAEVEHAAVAPRMTSRNIR
jgi:hypothetical protein